jgi:hypothetical protein
MGTADEYPPHRYNLLKGTACILEDTLPLPSYRDSESAAFCYDSKYRANKG